MCLCLLAFNENAPNKVNSYELIGSALYYVIEGSEQVQELSFNFIESYQALITRNLQEMATSFLKYYNRSISRSSSSKSKRTVSSPDSQYITSTAHLLRKLDRKQKYILPEEVHQQLINISHHSS